MNWKRDLRELCSRRDGMEKKPLIILTGPTAVGKTETSIRLAQAIGAEIISADSMQVYRGMDIGTAKIKNEEMKNVPHYLIDEFEPDEEFNVMIFQNRAKKYMEDIYSRGKIPLIVGGTGFYIQSVLYNIDFAKDQEPDGFREEMAAFAEEFGKEALHNKLKEVDIESANAIHPNNVKRVIRALEYYHFTGEKFSVHNETERQKESPYEFLYLVLNSDRSLLYERINQRVDQMIEEGLVDEVRNLLQRGFSKNLVSMQGLGYKELVPYLEGNGTLEDAIYQIKRDTRHFAKRQLTWFGREKEVTMLEKDQFSSVEHIVEHIIGLMKQKNIIK